MAKGECPIGCSLLSMLARVASIFESIDVFSARVFEWAGHQERYPRTRRFLMRPIVGERWRMRSAMYSGNSAAGTLAGMPSTTCDGTQTIKASGALFKLCS